MALAVHRSPGVQATPPGPEGCVSSAREGLAGPRFTLQVMEACRRGASFHLL